MSNHNYQQAKYSGLAGKKPFPHIVRRRSILLLVMHTARIYGQ
jgi:hypothetical protein